MSAAEIAGESVQADQWDETMRGKKMSEAVRFHPNHSRAATATSARIETSRFAMR